MEIFFNYETMKHTLVLTAYIMLITFDCWWFGYLIVTFIKWGVKKIKELYTKIRHKDEIKEDSANE